MHLEDRRKRLAALDKRSAPIVEPSPAIRGSRAETSEPISRPAKRLKTSPDQRSGEDNNQSFTDPDGFRGQYVTQLRTTQNLSECQSSAKNDPIIINSDDENEEDDVQRAIKLSLETAKTVPEVKPAASLAPLQMKYDRGEVLLTTVDGYSQKSHHVSIDELFQRNALRRAVLASFQIDLEWLVTKLNIGRTALHIAFHWKGEDSQENITRGCKLIPKCFPIFPPMNGVNCMHSKLQLLFFDTFLRVVIPSANLMPHDWGVGGAMENVMYVQDFPLLRVFGSDDDTEDESDTSDAETQHKSSKKTDSEFLKDITYFLEKSNYPRNIINDLPRYDFRRAENVRFVGSIGGPNYGDDIKKTGLARLAHVLRDLNLSLPPATFTIDFLTSSIGALNRTFIASLMSSCSGSDASLRTPVKVSDAEFVAMCEDLHIVFPTEETVRKSNAGFAGTICLQSSYFTRSEFPRSTLVDHIAIRRGVLSHCKIILCRSKSDDGGGKGWAYVGSANCSASAWGDKLVKDRKLGTWKLALRNWEAGVVVSRRMIEGREPVIVGQYVRNEKPWYFMEQ